MKKSDRRGGVLGAFIGLTILVCIVCSVLYVVRNLRVVNTHRQNGEDVSIDTPAGRIDIRAHKNLDPSALGVPVYPGAKRTKDGGGATFQWTSRDGKNDKGLSVAGGELLTPDSAGKVVEYYRTQLPDWIVITEHDGSRRFEFTNGGYKRIIAIHEKGDGTHIGIATVGEPASN